MDCSKLDTWLETKTSLPNFTLSIIFLWLVATCTFHLSVSAIMQTASAMGSSSTGCCKRCKTNVMENLHMNFHSLDQGSTFIHSEKVVQMNACPVENQRHLKKKKKRDRIPFQRQSWYPVTLGQSLNYQFKAFFFFKVVLQNHYDIFSSLTVIQPSCKG